MLHRRVWSGAKDQQAHGQPKEARYYLGATARCQADDKNSRTSRVHKSLAFGIFFHYANPILRTILISNRSKHWIKNVGS